MPTQKKRIALAVPEEIDRILTQISELNHTPKTVLINELLADSLPFMLQTLEALQHIKNGKKDVAMNLMAGLLKDAGFQLDEAQHDFFEKKRGR